jgi:hypothetical protein
MSNLHDGEKNIDRIPDGHFYSAIPDLKYVEENKEKLFSSAKKNFEGIKVNEISQRHLLYQLGKFYSDKKFKRFHEPNGSFPIGDAVVLQCMLRNLRPKRIIEVGSGFSSAVTLDTREFFLPELKCTFIEPYPTVLNSVLLPEDSPTLIQQKLQDVDLTVFDDLGESDVLFIDSSHVIKIGSELNTIFFEILPRLKPGVIIHFHDIFYPFMYPMDWVYDGIFWNEAYLLRAFLMNNPYYEIVYWNSFMGNHWRETVLESLPDCSKHFGASLYLRKK